jgi:hypothetical protein
VSRTTLIDVGDDDLDESGRVRVKRLFTRGPQNVPRSPATLWIGARPAREGALAKGPHFLGWTAGVGIAAALIVSGIVTGSPGAAVLGAGIALITAFMVVRHVLHNREWSEWHGDPDPPTDDGGTSSPA